METRTHAPTTEAEALGRIALQPKDSPMVKHPAQSTALMQMIASAMDGGRFDISDIRELLAVKKEWEADEARKAFNEAFANFKAEAVHVYKGTTITDGPLKGKRHANLFDVVVASAGPLAKHGLSTSWKLTKDEPAMMEVTCILKHSAGHSETVSMSAAPDTGPGRNAIQARGSAKSYLERYTLMAILGLAATEDDDDDGNGKKETDEQRNARETAEKREAEWLAKIGGAKSVSEYEGLRVDLIAAYGGGTSRVPKALRDFCIEKKALLSAQEKTP